MNTPTTPSGLRQYDALAAAEAAVRAWTTPGPNPAWHAASVRDVRDRMPLLARALDLLADLRDIPRHIAAGSDWVSTASGWPAVGLIAAVTLLALVAGVTL